MTLLKSSDQNSREINVALLSLEADIKNKIANFDTSEIDKQLGEINSRIDQINAGNNNTSTQINDIRNEMEGKIEDKLSDIFSASNKVTDFNTTTNSGVYYWVSDAANKPGSVNNGVLLVNKHSDWINQVAYGTTNKIYFRQNINSGNWTEWKAVAFDGERISNALTVNGKTYDGSEAIDAGIQTVENGGTGATTAKEAFKNLASGLSENDDPLDTEYMIYKNTNGTHWGLYTLSTFWNYIKNKISSVLGLTKDNYGGKSSKSGFLSKYTSTRPTSGNIVPKDATEYGGLRKDVVTISGQDGHLLTMFWDTSGRWDSQLFVSDGVGVSPELKVRQKSNKADYGPWVDLITSDTIGSQTVANADTVDSYHASQLWRSDGATWNPSANVTMTPSGNGQEWSFDFRNKNGVTGSYYQVWDEDKKTLLKVNADDGKVSAPYGFVGNLSGNVTGNKLTIQGQTGGSNSYTDTNPKLVFNNLYGSQSISLTFTDYDTVQAPASLTLNGNQGNEYFIAPNIKANRNITIVGGRGAEPSTYGSEPLTIGLKDGGSLGFDFNSIQARTNGEASNMYINYYGGMVILNGLNQSSGGLKVNNKLIIPIGAPSNLEDGCIWIER